MLKPTELFLRILMLALLVGGVTPGTAAASDSENPKVNYTTFSNDQLSDALKQLLDAKQPDWCGSAVPLTNQMVTRGSFPPQITSLDAYANLMCAVDEKRWTDAYPWMVALERRSGEKVDFGMGVAISYLAERYDAAEKRLFVYIDDDGRTTLTDAETRAVWNMVRNYGAAKQPGRTLALFRALAIPARLEKFGPEDRDSIGSRLFRAEIEAGNDEAAAANLDFLKSPYVFRIALADRRYAKLWPQIEAKVGRNMADAIGATVDRAKAEYDAAPDDIARVQSLANAYLVAGRFDDVVALVVQYEPAPDAYATLTENMGWALNAKAYALDALGRPGDAEAIFDRIAALELGDQTRGWLVNFVINRAIRLVDLGQAEKALAAAELAKGVATEAGSDFARMLVRRTTLCALQALGRTADMGPLTAEVIKNASEVPAEAAEALLCAGADDQAAQIIRDGLNDPARASAVIEALQSPDFQLYYNESVTPDLFDRIRTRPDIAPLFDRLARDIPRAFVPLFTVRRAALRSARAAASER